MKIDLAGTRCRLLGTVLLYPGSFPPACRSAAVKPTASCPLALHRVGCHAHRVDFLGDIHGDEEIEYNFLAGNEGIPAWDNRLRKLQDEFCGAFLHTSPDFQLGNGYGAARACPSSRWRR